MAARVGILGRSNDLKEKVEMEDRNSHLGG
jgi:hypothetical protein